MAHVALYSQNYEYENPPCVLRDVEILRIGHEPGTAEHVEAVTALAANPQCEWGLAWGSIRSTRRSGADALTLRPGPGRTSDSLLRELDELATRWPLARAASREADAVRLLATPADARHAYPACRFLPVLGAEDDPEIGATALGHDVYQRGPEHIALLRRGDVAHGVQLNSLSGRADLPADTHGALFRWFDEGRFRLRDLLDPGRPRPWTWYPRTFWLNVTGNTLGNFTKRMDKPALRAWNAPERGAGRVLELDATPRPGPVGRLPASFATRLTASGRRGLTEYEATAAGRHLGTLRLALAEKTYTAAPDDLTPGLRHLHGIDHGSVPVARAFFTRDLAGWWFTFTLPTAVADRVTLALPGWLAYCVPVFVDHAETDPGYTRDFPLLTAEQNAAVHAVPGMSGALQIALHSLVGQLHKRRALLETFVYEPTGAVGTKLGEGKLPLGHTLAYYTSGTGINMFCGHVYGRRRWTPSLASLLGTMLARRGLPADLGADDLLASMDRHFTLRIGDTREAEPAAALQPVANSTNATRVARLLDL